MYEYVDEDGKEENETILMFSPLNETTCGSFEQTCKALMQRLKAFLE